jgi:cytochrome c oxidase assembly protein subunit 15
MNCDMTLPDFKFIYYMEWSHRILGRIVGVAFAVPFTYFVLRRQINGKKQFISNKRVFIEILIILLVY